MQRRACIDDTEAYRYKLSRIWNSDKPMVMFIMLNPSTADADVDDPTIRRSVVALALPGVGDTVGCGWATSLRWGALTPRTCCWPMIRWVHRITRRSSLWRTAATRWWRRGALLPRSFRRGKPRYAKCSVRAYIAWPPRRAGTRSIPLTSRAT